MVCMDWVLIFSKGGRRAWFAFGVSEVLELRQRPTLNHRALSALDFNFSTSSGYNITIECILSY